MSVKPSPKFHENAIVELSKFFANAVNDTEWLICASGTEGHKRTSGVPFSVPFELLPMHPENEEIASKATAKIAALDNMNFDSVLISG
jgi:hypothetical protein